MFGQIQGTPTIKFIKPSKKNAPGVYKKKDTQDYNGPREAGPLREFAEANMPNAVEKIEGDSGLQTFLTKAEKYGLPRALVFSDKSLSAAVKAASTEYRRRVLIGEVRTTKLNQGILQKYGVTTKDLPKLVALDADDKPISLDKKLTYNAIDMFLGKHALKKPVISKEKQAAEGEEKKQSAPKKVESKKATKKGKAEAEPPEAKDGDQKFHAMKIKEIKLFLLERGEACADCVEKAQFVQRAIQLRDAPVVAPVKSEL